MLAKNDAWSFPASEDGACLRKRGAGAHIGALGAPARPPRRPSHSIAGWVKAHNAVRLDMKDIGEALDAVLARLQKGEAVQPWVVANLQAYWPKFEELVHHHHDNEERIVVPGLKAVGCEMPPKMSTDHESLLKVSDLRQRAGTAEQPRRAH